jgi:hypothetical protein
VAASISRANLNERVASKVAQRVASVIAKTVLDAKASEIGAVAKSVSDRLFATPSPKSEAGQDIPVHRERAK